MILRPTVLLSFHNEMCDNWRNMQSYSSYIFLDRKVGTYLKINTNSKWIVYNWGIELTHFCICLELKQSIIPNEKCECLTDAAQERNVLESFGPAAEIHLGVKSKILFGN